LLSDHRVPKLERKSVERKNGSHCQLTTRLTADRHDRAKQICGTGQNTGRGGFPCGVHPPRISEYGQFVMVIETRDGRTAYHAA